MSDERSAGSAATGPGAKAPLPLALWAVALLMALGGLGFLLGVFGAGPSILAGGLIGLQTSAEGRVLLAIVAVAMLLAAVGVLLRIRSAWGLTMLLVGIGLAVNLYAYVRGDPNYLRLALFVATAFYLNQRSVREVFLGPGSRRLRA